MIGLKNRKRTRRRRWKKKI